MAEYHFHSLVSYHQQLRCYSNQLITTTRVQIKACNFVNMLVPIFTLNLNHRFLPHRVAVGSYDGKHPCLTAATTGDKVLIHSPHLRGSFLGGRVFSHTVSSDISLLNINQSVSALAAGNLIPNGSNDILVVGTPTSVLAYDIVNNADLFYKELPDGASTLIVGELGNLQMPVAVVGGNCSLQGFDYQGNDVFWTVTGDNVSALTVCDVDDDGQPELLVGSEDFDIRVFKDDEIIAEMSETEAVTSLCLMQGSRYGYSLANGTVGVYDKITRNWRIKSKNYATSILGFDLDADGVAELVTGWSNGKVDVRSDHSGEVIFKDSFPHSIAGIVQADYRLDGKTELICCSVAGEVRGFLPASGEIQQSLLDSNVEQDTIRDLVQKKHNLMLELQNYVDSSRITGSIQSNKMSFDSRLGMIPADTQLQVGIAVCEAKEDHLAHVEIALMTSNDTVIRAVIVFAEGIFDGESRVIHPKENELTNLVRVPIMPPKDVPVDLHLKVLVGYRGSIHFHVFEVSRQLPRFSMYALCKEGVEITKPVGIVTFTINDRIQRVVLWLNQNFLLMDEIELADTNVLDINFVSLRTSHILGIRMEASGLTTVSTNDMDLAGTIVQAMAAFLNIEDLASTCDFPAELEKLSQTLQKVEDFNSTRQAMIADTADHSAVVRSLIIRAEDCRLIRDYKNMRQWYVSLFDINKDLVSNYKIRTNNHQELLNCLKIVNQTIQKSGQLRVGKSKTQLITACRTAIQNHNTSALFKLIRTGAT